MSDQGIDRPREIRGPEYMISPRDFEAALDPENLGNMSRQEIRELFGRGIWLAMDSEEGYQSFAHTADEDDVYSGRRFDWRSLSDKLKGPSEGKL